MVIAVRKLLETYNNKLLVKINIILITHKKSVFATQRKNSIKPNKFYCCLGLRNFYSLPAKLYT